MSASEADHRNESYPLTLPDISGVVPTSAEARAKRRIAVLEDELENMKQERRGKQRKTTFYVSQGRAIRRMGVLYTNLEDLIAENDRRYEEGSEGATPEHNRLQRGYIIVAQVLPWLHERLGQLEVDDCQDMLKQLKRGADAARGDDTSTLKDLVATWINEHFHPPSLLKSDDKHARGFVHDVCGKLLCPSEWNWDDNRVKAGIRDRTSDYIVSENSWPLFLYENYAVKLDNLEQGLFKSKILVQAFKAARPVTTKPSQGQNLRGLHNQHEESHSSLPGVRFALSNISSWHTVDADFDYEVFWSNVVDFFENVPGPVTQQRVNHLLEWWTRKIFGKNHCEDLTPEVVSQMSVTALAEQRKALEDAAFDSD
ncbi:hypothetical protein EV424DRAFT_1545938 [Suillus variegatus]|nr:hypothetical protein EV424DRAFT_1545938 [Suillus variegatus]